MFCWDTVKSRTASQYAGRMIVTPIVQYSMTQSKRLPFYFQKDHQNQRGHAKHVGFAPKLGMPRCSVNTSTPLPVPS